MKLKEIVIDNDSPFANCKLNREKYATILTGIVNSYADGFVLAINNEWGAGKSTFINMWKQQLENQGFQTLLFNAWENDFESNPLIPILSELKTLTGEQDNETFKSVLKKAAVFSKSLLPTLAKAIADKYLETGVIQDAIEKITEGSTDILKEQVDEYAAKKKGLIEFKSVLKDYIEKNKEGKPIVFIIDELDRCRPNYAVEVLEQIKHFFNVEGIVFVLSIDKVQLGHAVRGVYGSEQIDANEYLRRFIDIEYNIPKPDTATYCNYLFDYFNFMGFFQSEGRKNNNTFKRDAFDFKSLAVKLFESSNLSLRQQEKIFAHARIGLRQFPENWYVFPHLYLVLVFIRTLSFDTFKKIQNKQLSLQELMDVFYDIVKGCIDSQSRNTFISIEAQLIYYYANHIEAHSAEKLVNQNPPNPKTWLNLKSQIDLNGDGDNIIHFLQELKRDYDTHSYSLDYLLKRIDLTEEMAA